MFSALKVTFRVFRGLLFSATKARGEMLFILLPSPASVGRAIALHWGRGWKRKPSNPEQCVSVWSHWQVKGSSIPVLFIPEILACWLAPH